MNSSNTKRSRQPEDQPQSRDSLDVTATAGPSSYCQERKMEVWTLGPLVTDMQTDYILTASVVDALVNTVPKTGLAVSTRGHSDNQQPNQLKRKAGELVLESCASGRRAGACNRRHRRRILCPPWCITRKQTVRCGVGTGQCQWVSTQ